MKKITTKLNPCKITNWRTIAKKKELRHAISCGSIFIYPTDTIYGLGCNALDEAAVKRVRKLKNRDSEPFSVIAPSKKWVYDNCVVSREAKKFIEEKLPGAYTLILKLKNKKCVAPNVTGTNTLGTLGVRIPKHDFTELIQFAGVPFVTTSVNKSGEQPMHSLEDADYDILTRVDKIVYEGPKYGEPSTIKDFVKNKTIKRK